MVVKTENAELNKQKKTEIVKTKDKAGKNRRNGRI